MAGAKKAKIAGRSKAEEPKFVDDGERYRVISKRTGRPVYLGSGVALPEAQRLAQGLLEPTVLKKVDA